MKTVWDIRKAYKKKELPTYEDLNDITLTILKNRGLTDEDDIYNFINPDLSQLHNPFLMKNMREVMDVVNSTINKKGNIFIYGDHDVDGCTSVSILLKIFNEKLNYPVEYYIPNKLYEGYGLKKDAIDVLHMLGCNLIITVDCGITAKEEVEYAKSLGIEVIITDHHSVQNEIVPNCLILNPKQEGCNYPNKNLAGCGVAFKLACALYPNLINEKDIFDYLNIVAFGSIADVVPLIGENRVIAHFGCYNMANSNVLGLRKLIEASGIQDKTITSGQVGFTLAPKINAINRVGKSELAIELLTSDDESDIIEIVEELEYQNKIRQEIEGMIIEESLEMIRLDPTIIEHNMIILVKKDWHTGVLGIAASKICEKFYKPTIILSIDENGLCKGSARSIPKYSIFEGLQSCNHLLTNWGGHSVAAGLSLDIKNLEEFKTSMYEHSSKLTEDDLTKVIKVDFVLPHDVINQELIDEIKLLEPFGIGNPKPNLLIKDLTITSNRIIGKLENHTKLGSKEGVDILLFNYVNKDIPQGCKFDVIGDIDINNFRGVNTRQILGRDWRIK